MKEFYLNSVRLSIFSPVKYCMGTNKSILYLLSVAQDGFVIRLHM